VTYHTAKTTTASVFAVSGVAFRPPPLQAASFCWNFLQKGFTALT